MKFVLDASLALSWCFEDERTPFTEAALRALPRLGAAAPFLWCYEVSNGLRTAQKSGRIPSEESATAILEDLDALPIELIYQPPGATLVDARRLALQQNLSVYDASYLVLAQSLSLPIGTLDGTGRRMGLKQAAAAIGVDLVDEAMLQAWLA